MNTFRDMAAYREWRTAQDGTFGFVATMGYLHAGHMALVEASQADNDQTAVSIFVNPTQFNNPDDLDAYPRDEARDLDYLKSANVDAVFLPSAADMYPDGFQTYVTVERVSQGLEGQYRAGHFQGVATVVTKLFNVIQPTRAYFGQKDAQQVAVIRQMVRDLAMPVEIVACPTMREADGLAMSSRNARLASRERQAATVLYRALQAAKSAYRAGDHHPANLRILMQETLHTEPLAKIDYVSVADANTLQELNQETNAPLLLSMAVFIGDVRLIDNMLLNPS